MCGAASEHRDFARRKWGWLGAARVQEEQAHRDEAERRSAVLGMRRSIEEETAANEERRRRLQEAQERVAQLRVRWQERGGGCNQYQPILPAVQVPHCPSLSPPHKPVVAAPPAGGARCAEPGARGAAQPHRRAADDADAEPGAGGRGPRVVAAGHPAEGGRAAAATAGQATQGSLVACSCWWLLPAPHSLSRMAASHPQPPPAYPHTHPFTAPTRLQLEDLDVLKACVGWQLEGAREDPVSGEAALRLADLFRVRLTISRTQAAASVEVLPGGCAGNRGQPLAWPAALPAWSLAGLCKACS